MDKRIKITAKDKALHRVQIIQGHLRAIEKMLHEDKYCIDIVHQSRAVQKALKQMDLVIIKDHLNSCVIDHIKSGREAETTEELLKLFEYK